MKRFIKMVLMFLLPLGIGGIILEGMIRHIPNDYKYKRAFLDHKSDSIQVLLLGSSHTFYGVQPAYMRLKAFNAGHISQSLDMDYEILHKYEHHWKNLTLVAIPISYFSLNWRIKNGIQDWRVKNYSIYYGIAKTGRPKDYSELLSVKFDLNVKRLISYYIHGRSEIDCDSAGWGTGYNSKDAKDLVQTGRTQAIGHTENNPENFSINLKALKDIVAFCEAYKVQVLLYTPPVYRTYIAHMDSTQWASTSDVAKNLAADHKNVHYTDFMQDPAFIAADFYDANHLDEKGAKKFTLKLDSCINAYLPGTRE